MNEKELKKTVRMVEWMEEVDFLYTSTKTFYTEDNLRKMGLNERQIKAVMHIKEKGKITNKKYQEICDTSERTATRDLAHLVSQEIFEQVGIAGKGTNYILKTPQRRQTIEKPEI